MDILVKPLTKQSQQIKKISASDNSCSTSHKLSVTTAQTKSDIPSLLAEIGAAAPAVSVNVRRELNYQPQMIHIEIICLTICLSLSANWEDTVSNIFPAKTRPNLLQSGQNN